MCDRVIRIRKGYKTPEPPKVRGQPNRKVPGDGHGGVVSRRAGTKKRNNKNKSEGKRE